tara:strand:- start:296 stop:616 length:321 start_codon:yes stop_codon:yes gene_type:complete
MNTQEIIKKGKVNLEVSQHFVDQFKLRFGMDVNVRDSFQRAKQVNRDNAMKFGKTIMERTIGKLMYEPNQKLYINTYYDQVFVVDFNTNMLVTTYKLSEVKSQYNA